MLTVPKLTHHPQHKRQNTLQNLLVNNMIPSTKIHIDQVKSDKIIQLQNDSTIYLKQKAKISQKRNLSNIQPTKILVTEPSMKVLRQKNFNHNQLKILPQKNKNQIKKQLQKQNKPIMKKVKECFSPKYLKQRQYNQKILYSLKLENEKHKKLILQNQYLYTKQKNVMIQPFDFMIQSKNINDFISHKSKKVPQSVSKHPFYNPRKALQQMTSSLTNSIIVDENNSHIFQQTFQKIQIFSQNKVDKLKASDFVKMKFLGKGNFGEVNLVRHKNTNFVCAMKTIKKSFAKEQNVIHQISRQIRIHLSLKHLNIIGFYGFFDDSENVYLLIQYATGGELYKKLKQCYRMPQKDVAPIVKNALDGLKMIHSLGYIHRDLKPENIIFQFGIGKICDMGWAADCGFNEMRKSYCGTPLYLPPQMIRKESYDQSADIWSIGILTYQLLVGKIPFNIWSEYDLQQIVQRQIKFPTSYVDMSNECIDFMMKCLTKDPNKRIKLQNLLNHPFLSKQSKQGYFNAQLYDAMQKLF